MKFTSIFFTASAGSICAVRRIYTQTSKKYEVYFNFFTASAGSICAVRRIYTQTSKKYEVYFNIFYSECRQYMRRKAKIYTNCGLCNKQEIIRRKDCCKKSRKQLHKTTRFLSFLKQERINLGHSTLHLL